MIVPSYREDASVIRQTLLSAALQEYPAINVVLLIDDPPNPDDPHQLALLESARALPGEINDLLQAPRERFDRALEIFETRLDAARSPSTAMRTLAAQYVEAGSVLTGDRRRTSTMRTRARVRAATRWSAASRAT